MNLNTIFRKIATGVSLITGSAGAFITALLIILTWIITGPIFNYSNTWQLAINTFTTIATFLMVFLIQNTQNRDSKAIHLKLDELIKATKGARDKIVNVEELSDEMIDEMHKEFRKLQEKYLQKTKIETKTNHSSEIEKFFSHLHHILEK